MEALKTVAPKTGVFLGLVLAAATRANYARGKSKAADGSVAAFVIASILSLLYEYYVNNKKSKDSRGDFSSANTSNAASQQEVHENEQITQEQLRGVIDFIKKSKDIAKQDRDFLLQSLNKPTTEEQKAFQALFKVSSYARFILMSLYLPAATLIHVGSVSALVFDPSWEKEVSKTLMWVATFGFSGSHIFSAADVVVEGLKQKGYLSQSDLATTISNIATIAGILICLHSGAHVGYTIGLSVLPKITAALAKSSNLPPKAAIAEILAVAIGSSLTAISAVGGAVGEGNSKMLFNAITTACEAVFAAARGRIDSYVEENKHTQVVKSCLSLFDVVIKEIESSLPSAVFSAGDNSELYAARTSFNAFKNEAENATIRTEAQLKGYTQDFKTKLETLAAKVAQVDPDQVTQQQMQHSVNNDGDLNPEYGYSAIEMPITADEQSQRLELLRGALSASCSMFEKLSQSLAALSTKHPLEEVVVVENRAYENHPDRVIISIDDNVAQAEPADNPQPAVQPRGDIYTTVTRLDEKGQEVLVTEM